MVVNANSVVANHYPGLKDNSTNESPWCCSDESIVWWSETSV